MCDCLITSFYKKIAFEFPYLLWPNGMGFKRYYLYTLPGGKVMRTIFIILNYHNNSAMSII